MILDAGHIAIDMRGGIRVTSTRPQGLGRVFRGKTPAEATVLMPLLFAVCGKAHGAASAMALASVTERGAEICGEAVAIEAIREHLMRIAADWTKALGLVPDPQILRRIHGLARLEAAEARNNATLLMEILAAAPVNIERHGMAALEDGGTIAARILRMVKERNWHNLGASSGIEDETTCFTLMCDHPLVRPHGDGLMARLLARLAHLCELLNADCPTNAFCDEAGRGVAEIATARGVLTHRVVLRDGLIEDYEIIAPTDRNFGSTGPAAASLAALAADCHDDIEGPARLLIEAYDPCVAYSLWVN
jgi:hypothetical protein